MCITKHAFDRILLINAVRVLLVRRVTNAAVRAELSQIDCRDSQSHCSLIGVTDSSHTMSIHHR